ncbi:helix-turn-helix transcriptional regulator [Nonomuraea terrae]|uniref:helix-turn-helix transcriptional regulator n=1 Tax=Nonomuraea terrae TaxID=2530383 RepID=UPI00379B2064
MDLVGRRHALSAVAEMLAAGSGALVAEGPAGIGKSLLLQEAAGLARARGMTVAYARATELDRVAPLSTLLRALARLGTPTPAKPHDPIDHPPAEPPGRTGHPAHRGPAGHHDPADQHGPLGGRDGSAPGEHDGGVVGGRGGAVPGVRGGGVPAGFPAVERAGAMIGRAALTRPVVVVLDDAQWADELTCLALRHLVPELAGSPVVWLLGRRPFPAQTAVDALLAEGARRVTLPPLDPGEAAAFCARLLGAEPGPSVLELARAGGGNPFLLAEVLNGLRAQGRISVTRGIAEVAGSELPAGFGAAVGRRLRDLPAEARRLLEAGAVLRRPFTVHEAAGLLGAPPGALLAHVEAAVRAGALVGDGDRLTFRHDLIREAVYDGLPAAVRAALHREAAAVLRREGRPAAELAEHLRHGARAGDVAAIRELRAAAEDMTAVAPSAAADLMLRALELAAPAAPGTPAADERPGLAARVVRLLASAGRLAEAREVADARDVTIGPAEAAEVALGLAEALKHAGDDRGVIRRTARALALPGVPVRERARLLAVRAHALVMSGPFDAADRAADAAVASGEAFAQVVGLQARSAVALFRGDPEGALRHAARAVALADAAGGEAAHRHPRLWLGAALAALDRFEEAEETYAVVERESGRLGTAWSSPLLHRFRAGLLLAAGRVDEAAAEAETGLRVARRLSAPALTPVLLGVLGQVALLRGDLQAARAYVDRARDLTGDVPTLGPGLRPGLGPGLGPGLVPAELHWRRLLLDAATPLTYPRPAPGPTDPIPPTGPFTEDGTPARRQRAQAWAGALAYLVVLEPWEAARLRAVPGVREFVRDLARRNPGIRSFTASAAHVEGRLEEAIELYRAGPRPLGLAAALEEAGRHAEAREVYQRCGISRIPSPAEGMVPGGGGREGPDGVRPEGQGGGQPERPDNDRREGRGDGGSGPASAMAGADVSAPRASGWAALTPAELRVVRLVAQGMTNREVATALFLSRHTVDSHLRHAFAKLGVHRRVELTRHVLTHEHPD